MPVTCPKCGRETGRQEKFCESCGAFLGWEEGEPADTQEFPPQAPQRGGDQVASVRVQIRDDLLSVAPGNAESTTFTLKNFGTQVEQFRCAVTGPEWLAAEPATMTVYPGDEATGTVQAAPPRKPGSVAGVTPFRLTVTSALHAHVSSSVSGSVEVAPFYELAAELVPTSSTGRGQTRHRVTLDNRGNVPLRVTLHATDVAGGLRLGLPTAADVPPGRVIEVPVSVYGSRRWTGRPEPKAFAIVAEPPKPLARIRLRGTRVVLPVFARWVPLAAGLAVAAAAAIAIPKLTAQNGAGPPQSPAAPAGGASSSATVTVQVWFLDSHHVATGQEPLFHPVTRQVRPPALAAGALDALFAGPAEAEKASGLELITSGATGYSNLRIQDGIAYVTLQGGCSSGGSTMTIADEITPILRQFASVSFVKIYAPDGATEHPTGASDSIPVCLEG